MSVQPEPVKGVVPMVASVVQPVQQVMVQIPAGMAPGMQMQVQIPGRGCMMVQIPAGLAPGGTFPVSLPAQPTMAQPMMTPQPTMMPTGPRFDASTGQPIPKFDPKTGKQNWWDEEGSVQQQPMMVAPTAGAQVAPMMAMPQVVAPNAQVMARDFETTKGKLFEQGTAAYSSGTFDCTDGIDAPLWCGAVVVGSCVGLPLEFLYWLWYGHKTGKAVGETNEVAQACCACIAWDYMAGKVAQVKGIKEDVGCECCLLWCCCGYCKRWQLRREAEQDAQVKQTLSLYSGKWKQGLFGCMDNPQVCLCVTCCYPCARGLFYSKLGKNCVLYGLCGGFCLEYTRGRIVAAKGIKEGLCEYGLKLLCCGACMDCQLFAEIEGSG